MKTCKHCGKEFDDALTFCPFCEKENADKKLTYIEKKQAKDKDTEIILSKASIQDEDIKDVMTMEPTAIFAGKEGTREHLELLSIIRMFVSVVVIIGCIIWAQITLGNDLDQNIKLLIVVVAYFVVAVAGAILISDVYIIRAFRALEKDEYTLKKINFGKGPMFAAKGVIYEIKTNAKCRMCDGDLHVEDKDNEIYLVCSHNRAHLYKVDKDKFFEGFKDQIEQNK